MKETRAPNNDAGAYKDKNLIGGTPGTLLQAEDRNALQSELLAIQDALGLVRSYADLEQVKKAIGLQNAGAFHYIDSGTINNYILDRPANMILPFELRPGMVFLFRPLNTNSGASQVKITSSGSNYDILKADGSTPLTAREIDSNRDCILIFMGSYFKLLSLGFFEANLQGIYDDSIQVIHDSSIVGSSALVIIPDLLSKIKGLDIYISFDIGYRAGTGSTLHMTINDNVATNYINLTTTADYVGGGVTTTGGMAQNNIPLPPSQANIAPLQDFKVLKGRISRNILNSELNYAFEWLSRTAAAAGAQYFAGGQILGVLEGETNIDLIKLISSSPDILESRFLIYAKKTE